MPIKPAEEKRNQIQVLLAEDETDLANIICDALNERGCKVLACNSLSLTQQRLANQKFDILVFDINLVDGSIAHLIQHLRTHEYGNLNLNTPIIIISGFLDAGLVSSVRSYIQGALVKPFSIDDLMSKIEPLSKKKMAG